MVNANTKPNLAALAALGTTFANARSVFPLETWVAAPLLITERQPGAHGMVAKTLFDTSVAPARLQRTKLVEDVMALAQGGESGTTRQPGRAPV